MAWVLHAVKDSLPDRRTTEDAWLHGPTAVKAKVHGKRDPQTFCSPVETNRHFSIAGDVHQHWIRQQLLIRAAAHSSGRTFPQGV